MSLQWIAVAGFLYFEIALVCLLMLPFISATRWQKVFRSRIFQFFRSYANIYFNLFIMILILLFVDSVRDVAKYQGAHTEGPDLSNNPMSESLNNMKLFRAQRNFYIAGFALFLFVIVPRYYGNSDNLRDVYKYQVAHDKQDVKFLDPTRSTIDLKMFRAQRNMYITGFTLFLLFVLRKLVTLISKQATLAADCEASRKQAESASAAAKAMMEKGEEDKGEEGLEAAGLQDQLNEAKLKIMELRNELEKSKTDLGSMKKQAEATNTEYDRLCDEHTQLQKKLEKLEGQEEGTKKDD